MPLLQITVEPGGMTTVLLAGRGGSLLLKLHPPNANGTRTASMESRMRNVLSRLPPI